MCFTASSCNLQWKDNVDKEARDSHKMSEVKLVVSEGNTQAAEQRHTRNMSVSVDRPPLGLSNEENTKRRLLFGADIVRSHVDPSRALTRTGTSLASPRSILARQTTVFQAPSVPFITDGASRDNRNSPTDAPLFTRTQEPVAVVTFYNTVPLPVFWGISWTRLLVGIPKMAAVCFKGLWHITIICF